LFNGEPGDEQSDVYALGVTVYRLFSGGHYPYGEMEPFSRPRFGKHTALTQHRPDLPMWLDMLLTKATAVEKSERLGDAMELAFELENGKARGGPVVTQKQPLYHRNPLLFWQLASLLLFLALLMAVLGK
jgi:serine/threonine protein kinase